MMRRAAGGRFLTQQAAVSAAAVSEILAKRKNFGAALTFSSAQGLGGTSQMDPCQ
jgi:hypothetical protein